MFDVTAFKCSKSDWWTNTKSYLQQGFLILGFKFTDTMVTTLFVKKG